MASCPLQVPTEDHIAHKCKWSPIEDEQLRTAIQEFGISSWNNISRRVPTRTGKQCRERWLGQLSPSVSKETWLRSEDAILMQAHATAGNRWTVIAAQLPGRSGLSIKNRWNWLMRHSGPLDPPPNVSPPPQFRMAVPDVIEGRRPSSNALEPLGFEAALFGARFQEFQAKMFMN
jgi:hypothetical protein